MKHVLTLGALIISMHCAIAQSQFASSVIAFSSEWSTTTWSAQQTLGAPNTTGCGDISTSWATSTSDGQREYIELGYTTAQPVSVINIYETWNPGAVDTVYLRDASNGNWNIVYINPASSALPCPRTNVISITTTSYNEDAVRLAINSPAVTGWNEIDAVEIDASPLVGMVDLQSLFISVFPNPASDKISVFVPDHFSGVRSFAIQDLSGREVMKTKSEGASIELDLSSIPAGSYFILIRSDQVVYRKQIQIFR